MFERAILHRAKQAPRSPAFWHRGAEVPYARFVASIEAVTATLAVEDWLRGGVVLVEVANLPLAWLLVLALERLGQTCVIASGSGEASALALVGPDVVITDRAAMSADAAPVVFRVGPEWVSTSLSSASGRPFVRRAPQPEDVIAIILSSGTTGGRKMVPFTRAMIDARVMGMKNSCPGGSRSLIALGMETMGAFIYPISSWAAGDTVIFFPGLESDFIASSRPDWVGMSPNLLHQTLQRWPAAFTSETKIRVELGGSSTPPALIASLRQRGGAALIISYGSTEGGVIASAPEEAMGEAPGASGYVMPWAEVKVATADGEVLPPGESGEIWTKHEGMASAYLRNPEATAHNFRDGWFRSGDVGRLMPDGLLIVEGRADDLLNIGGTKLTANEVEHAALELAGVIQAGAAAFGTSSGGWLLYCAVVGAHGLDLAHIAAQLTRQLRVPVRVVQLPEIPRNPMGKIQRDQLKAEIVKLGV